MSSVNGNPWCTFLKFRCFDHNKIIRKVFKQAEYGKSILKQFDHYNLIEHTWVHMFKY